MAWIDQRVEGALHKYHIFNLIWGPDWCHTPVGGAEAAVANVAGVGALHIVPFAPPGNDEVVGEEKARDMEQGAGEADSLSCEEVDDAQVALEHTAVS